jgi:hypothetical protein
LPSSATEPDVAENLHKFYEAFAIPADSFARAVAFAMSQPEEVDINEILFRPTRQSCNPPAGPDSDRYGWLRPRAVLGRNGVGRKPALSFMQQAKGSAK